MRRLKSQVVLFLILVLIFSNFMLSAYVVKKERENEIVRLNSKIEKVRNLIRITSIEPLWDIDVEKLKLNLNSIFEDDTEILSIHLKDITEEINIHLVKDVNYPMGEQIVAKVSLEKDHMKLGNATIIFTTATLEKKLNEIKIIFGLFIFGLLMSNTMIVVFGRIKDKQLGESEKYVRAIFNQAAVGFALTETVTGRIVRANQKYCEILELPLSEVEGRTFMEFTHLEDLDKDLEFMEKLMAGKIREYSMEKRYVNSRGADVWVNLTVSAMWSKGETTNFHVAVVEDITSRKKAETDLINSEQRFRELAELLPQAVFGMDLAGRLSFINNHAYEMFGYDYQDFNRGLNGYDMIAEDDREKVHAKLSDLTRNKKTTVGGEYNAQRKDGSIFPALIYVNGVFDNGKLIGFRGIFVDITEQIRMKDEKDDLERQYFQSQKMESMGLLAGGIAHDFNNILSGILGYSELALRKLPPESSMRNKLEAIHSSGMRARDLVSQILAFGRKDDQVRSKVQLPLIVKDALRLLRPAIPSTIDIKTQIASTCTVMGDPSRILQIIVNLCTNAYQAMLDTGGTLNISLSNEKLEADAASRSGVPPGHYGKLSVSDSGVGISTEIIDRIFEPYFTTKEKGKGTGLGLAAVHGIVKSHGGAILVESRMGDGTTFKVYLPLTLDGKNIREKEEPEMTGGNERVLIVDDEQDVLKVQKEMLEDLGYRLETASNAKDAIKLFSNRTNPFDLVITDMTMPVMTGDKLADELRKIVPHIPIILCTGFSDLITKEKAKLLGINGYLTKPVLQSDMARTVRRVLDEKKK